MRDDSWRDRAACRGVDVELFYSDLEVDVHTALAICARCEVRGLCLKQAMVNREVFGVWGGTVERQRRRAFRQRQVTRDTDAA